MKTLNIGAGTRTYDHYPTPEHSCVNYDIRDLPGIDVIGDARALYAFEDNEFDYILASDVIEHFPLAETSKILTEWFRVLKPGGEFEIKLPSLRYIMQFYNLSNDAIKVSKLLFGGQDYEQNFHYVAYDEDAFKQILDDLGMNVFEIKKHNSNMIFYGERPER